MTHYSDATYLLQRKNKKTGFNETLVFTGSLLNKPKGWKVVKQIAN